MATIALEPACMATDSRSFRRGVVFHVGGLACALDAEEVQEIVPMTELTTTPQAPPIVAGLLNLGGDVIPVVRLTRLFELPDREAELFTPLLVLKDTEVPLALLVDRVSRIVTIAADSVLAVESESVFTPCAAGISTIDGEPVTWLATDWLLLHQEQRCMAELAEREQARLAALAEVTP